MKRKIHIIAIGGTIAGTAPSPLDLTCYRAAALGIGEILDSLPPLPEEIDCTAEDLFRIESSGITADEWLTISRRINTLLASPECDGVVVTHGTDTMEESAFFLHLTVGSPKPVILTGAMRPATSLSADGPLNLYQAIIAAAATECRGLGTLVLMNGVLSAARDVRKINPVRTDAFTPVEMGAVGSIDENKVHIFYRPCRRYPFFTAAETAKTTVLPDVRIAFVHAGADAGMLHFFATQGADGIVIAGVGNGNISSPWRKAAAGLTAAGKMIVRTSRVNGFVNRNGAVCDDELGTIAAGNLSPQKARILLMLAMSRRLSAAEIQQIFDTY